MDQLSNIVNVPDPERLTRDGSCLAGGATIDAGEQHTRVTRASASHQTLTPATTIATASTIAHEHCAVARGDHRVHRYAHNDRGTTFKWVNLHPRKHLTLALSR